MSDHHTTGPPAVFEAIPDIDWQKNGWKYRPINHAAVARQMHHVAARLQDLANGTAAFGRGRGVYPERSGAMQEWSRLLRGWAEEMEGEAAQPTGTEAKSDEPKPPPG